MILRNTSILLAAAVLLGWVPEVQGQEARIDAIETKKKPVTETMDVRVTPIASLQPVNKVTVGMSLKSSDRVESVSGKTLLRISCGKGTLAHLSGKFRVMISAKPDLCLINLLAGRLHIAAEEPTETRLAGVVAGSRGTRYEIEVESDGASFIVFEDEIEITWLGSAAPAVLRQGQQTTYRSGSLVGVRPVASKEYEQAAETMARLDVAEAVARGRREPSMSRYELAALKSSYSQVFRSPNDTGAQQRLALARKALEPTSFSWPRGSGSNFQATTTVAALLGTPWLLDDVKCRSGSSLDPLAGLRCSAKDALASNMEPADFAKLWHFESPPDDHGMHVAALIAYRERLRGMVLKTRLDAVPAPPAPSQHTCVTAYLYRLLDLPDLASSVAREGLETFEKDADLSFSEFLACYDIAYPADSRMTPLIMAPK